MICKPTIRHSDLNVSWLVLDVFDHESLPRFFERSQRLSLLKVYLGKDW